MKEMCTLIWSEWRRQRKIFSLLLASTVTFYVLMVLLVHFKFFLSGIEVVASALTIGFPLLYAVGLCDSFASEFTNKSNSFLLGLPISKTKIYFAKYLSSFILFLVISIAGSLLMYSLTDVILNSRAFLTIRDLNTRAFSLISITLLCFWILAHIAVFLCNLINRNSNNGIIMLLILPVLLVILAPAVFVTNMFFFTSDAYWITASILSTILILYLIMLMLGWYLWNTRVSRDLKTLKPVLLTLGMMITASILLYGFAYVYINYQYDSVLQESRENKLKLSKIYNYQFAKESDTSNAMLDIMKFRKYRKKHKISRMRLYTRLVNKPYSIYKELWRKNTSPKEMLTNPDVQNLYSIVEKISTKHKIQYFKGVYNPIGNMRIAIIFLIDLAYAQRHADNNKAFFRTLKIAAKCCILLKEFEHSNDYFNYLSSRRLLQAVYYTIIKLGPEGAAYVDNYKDALKLIQNDKIYLPPYDLLPHLRYVMSLLNPRSSRDNTFNAMYYRLRARQGLVSWIRYEIKRNRLYLEAEKRIDLKEVIEKDRQLIKDSRKIYGFCKNLANTYGLYQYFTFRNRMTSDKICLALKIFRCRYGRYPDKLQELHPEILKDIPLIPINQKTYKYKRHKNGFILNAGKFKRSLYRSKKQFAFINMYIMKYQPWKAQKEEKNK